MLSPHIIGWNLPCNLTLKVVYTSALCVLSSTHTQPYLTVATEDERIRPCTGRTAAASDTSVNDYGVVGPLLIQRTWSKMVKAAEHLLFKLVLFCCLPDLFR